MAFQLTEDERASRRLCFSAGNHDWWDGLAAYSRVVCTAPDRLAQVAAAA